METIPDAFFILGTGVACGFGLSLFASLIGHAVRSMLDWMKGG